MEKEGNEWLKPTSHTVKIKEKLHLLIANHICSKCNHLTRVAGLLATHIFELDPEYSSSELNFRSRDPAYLSDIRTIGNIDSDELYAPGGPLVPSENQNSDSSFKKISLKLESPVGFDAGLRWIWNDRHDLFKSILRGHNLLVGKR